MDILLETFWELKAGVETGTPIILAFGAKYLDNLSLETAAAMTRAMADGLSIPVCLHLDHCKDIGYYLPGAEGWFLVL